MKKPIIQQRREAEPPAEDPNEPIDTPEQAAAGAAAGGPEEAGPEDERDEFATEEPTPEEQDAYARVVLAGSEILFGEKTHQSIVAMLKNQASNPAKALAEVAVLLVKQIDEKSGGTVPETVILAPAAEFIEQAGTIAVEAGLFPVDEAVLNRAVQIALEELAVEYDVTPEDLKAFLDGLDPAMMEKARAMQDQYANQGGAQASPAAQQQPAQAAPPAGAPASV